MVHMHRAALRKSCDPPPGPPVQAVFRAAPGIAARARSYARDVLACDEPPVVGEVLDDVLLVISELVTNAYRYGTEPGDSVRVAILTTSERVRVEVHDPVRRRPQFREEAGERIRGRGLHIVDALAARWDVDDRPMGKAVWAELNR